MSSASSKGSFQVMYIGGRQKNSFLKVGKIYNVSSVSSWNDYTMYRFKELNGEYPKDGFVKVCRREGPFSLLGNELPKVGERFSAFTGSLDMNGDCELLQSSEVLFVVPQSAVDKLFRRVKVLTKHLSGLGGLASLYELHY